MSLIKRVLLYLIASLLVTTLTFLVLPPQRAISFIRYAAVTVLGIMCFIRLLTLKPANRTNTIHLLEHGIGFSLACGMVVAINVISLELVPLVTTIILFAAAGFFWLRLNTKVSARKKATGVAVALGLIILCTASIRYVMTNWALTQ